jgi:hypothetical protein
LAPGCRGKSFPTRRQFAIVSGVVGPGHGALFHSVDLQAQPRARADAMFIACAPLRDKFVTLPDFDQLMSPIRKRIKHLNFLRNTDMKKGDTV